MALTVTVVSLQSQRLRAFPTSSWGTQALFAARRARACLPAEVAEKLSVWNPQTLQQLSGTRLTA